MRTNRLVHLCFLFLYAAVVKVSAEAQQVPVFTAETHLVENTVSVHNAGGGLVLDLAKDDLSVVEDGVPQTIRYFSHAEQMPLSIGLVIDSSGSQEKFFKEHERDIQEFLKQTMLKEDRAFAVRLAIICGWFRTGVETGRRSGTRCIAMTKASRSSRRLGRSRIAN
jgi:hypothetical protein